MNYREKSIALIENEFDFLQDNLNDFFNNLNLHLQHGGTLCLYGAGAIGNLLYAYLADKNIKVEYFCDSDSDKWHKPITNDKIMCIEPSKLNKIDNLMVIPTSRESEQIIKTLSGAGFNNITEIPVDIFVFLALVASPNLQKNLIIEGISKLFDHLTDELSQKVVYYKILALFLSPNQLNTFDYNDIYTDRQYIPQDIIEIGSNDIIVDCGAYTGDTLEFFILNNIKFERYYCYEMDTDNFHKLCSTITLLELENSAIAFNLGVGDKSDRVNYYQNQYSSAITKKGEKYAEIVSLDENLKDVGFTYIKMDIEGAELKALEGAKEHILRDTPKCAICIYHKFSDLWEIPLWIKNIVPEYKIAIRQHSKSYNDTLCYAYK